MAQELIISVSGVRGLIGENLTAALAAEYGCAFGSFLKDNASGRRRLKVCIGRDSRPSGPMLEAAVSAGLCSVGVDVVTLGIVATPTVGIMLRELECDGGVVITASHNPVPYNGVKLLLSNGIAPSPAMAQDIKQRFLDKQFSHVGSVDCGRTLANAEGNETHIGKVLPLVQPDVIARQAYRVVLDSVNGAGGAAGKQLLEQLGCDVVLVNGDPTGLFAHEPEPTAANLESLCGIVTDEQAVIGFAQDPDADRLAIVDENGSYIGEEFTLALAARQIMSQQQGKAAANLSTSRMIDDIAQAVGSEVIRTPVGEANVAGAMIENQCIIGGEGNGGVIDLRVGPIRDSLVAMALVLQLMAETGKTLSQLVAGIPAYAMLKEKYSANADQAQAIIQLAQAAWPGARINTSDGCRFDFEDSWVHLRVSNTEPVMRMITEARDPATAQGYADTVEKIRKKVLG
ncbi:MAG: phosphoglucosamine mutase [Phycisphaeraceae bacterium]|nr:phosphoglucosamine mutase [Phycisphaeraceae bacterium]